MMKIPAYRSVWLQLLLTASRGDYEVSFKGERIVLKPGQLTVGAYQLAHETGVPRGTVERILRCFKSEEMIEEQKSNKCTLVTILKWSQYQSNEEQNEEPVRNKWGTDEEQMRTNQEGEKVKKVKKRVKKDVAIATKATPRKYADGTNIILLRNEPMQSQLDGRDHSFPRKRVYGNEKYDWTLDYIEHLLGRKLTGQERWNRIYTQHLVNKYGMKKVRELVEFVCAPESWWFEKLSQVSTLYKNADRLFMEKDAKPKSENKILVIS